MIAVARKRLHHLREEVVGETAEEVADVALDAALAVVAGEMWAEQKTTAEDIAAMMYAVQVTYGITGT